jgi:carbon monoxide dehydrogenase subunit G
MASSPTRLQSPPEKGIESRARTLLAALLAGAIALAAVPLKAYPATIAVESKRDGNAVHLHARAFLKADLATAWRVLTDYERYVEFIPDLRTSRVVARSGPKVTVAQSGDAVWLLKWPLDITFEIIENPPASLQSRAVGGSLEALVSRYELTSSDSGTLLDYSGDVEAGFALFGRLEQAAVERNVTRQFKALADEIERQAERTAAHPVADVK